MKRLVICIIILLAALCRSCDHNASGSQKLLPELSVVEFIYIFVILLLIILYQFLLNKKKKLYNETQLIILKNEKEIKELKSSLKQYLGIQKQMDEQLKLISEIKEENALLRKSNIQLQEELKKYSFALSYEKDASNRLISLTHEVKKMRKMESYLIDQLISRDNVLDNLCHHPYYVKESDWAIIVDHLNRLTNNFTERISREIPSLSSYDLNICCLIKLHITVDCAATILGISPNSVTKQKQRIREKILLSTSSFDKSINLDHWIWGY